MDVQKHNAEIEEQIEYLYGYMDGLRGWKMDEPQDRPERAPFYIAGWEDGTADGQPIRDSEEWSKLINDCANEVKVIKSKHIMEWEYETSEAGTVQ